MCGICGIAGRNLAPETLAPTITGMTGALVHRGPDGRGEQLFTPPAVRQSVALGHTRLAIIDLSDAGSQPMPSEDGKIWMVFNGEIYNFRDLRAGLEATGHRFRSRTDAEVVLHLYEDQGPACVTRLEGMFAFAILDLRSQTLFLARDQIGVKPLYYCALPDRFLFCSEIKAILASGQYTVDVNWQAVSDYFTYLYVPCPQTIFRDIWQVPPAHGLLLDLETGSFKLESYWQVRRLPEVERASAGDLEAHVRNLLAESVRRQLVSDVPVGVLLSGGVDSTLVGGLAKQADASVRTFTVTFEGADVGHYNERETARLASRHLGTDHRELPVSLVEPLNLLDLIEHFDQPFGNPTFYLMHEISKYARREIRVALCGAGGDELFAGYPRYRAVQLARWVGWLPPLVRTWGRACLEQVRDSRHTARLRRAKRFMAGLSDDFVEQFARWTYFLDESQKARLLVGYHGMNGYPAWAPATRVLRVPFEASPLADPINRLLHLDVQTFLVNNVLEYTDKMSMAVGLEARDPLLDHRFVEFSLNVPLARKLRGGRTKLLLREAFADSFPPALRGAPKRGFNVPLPQWMLGTFDQYFEAGQGRAGSFRQSHGDDIGATWREGILDWSLIHQLRGELRQGRRDTSTELFSIITFDVWWRKYVRGSLPFRRWDEPRRAGIGRHPGGESSPGAGGSTHDRNMREGHA